MSQGDIELKTGLLRAYISRIENNYTIPTIDTLEKIAGALGMRLYEFMYDGDKPPVPIRIPGRNENTDWGSNRNDRKYFKQLTYALGKMTPQRRQMVLGLTDKLSRKKK